MFGGEQFDDRRLNNRYEGHVAVRRYGQRSKHFLRIAGSDEDRGRAVSCADDADGCRLVEGEAEERREERSHEDTELSRCCEEHDERLSHKRVKFAHCTNGDKDHDREKFVCDTRFVENVQEAFASGILEHCVVSGNVCKNAADAHREEQHRFIVVSDGEEHEDEADDEHREDAHICQSVNALEKLVKQTAVLSQSVHVKNSSS